MLTRSLAAFACVVLLTSCANKLENRAAVERGVRKRLAQHGLNADSMDVDITNVNFHDGKADATVAFAPKGGKLSQGLTMKYTLEQRDNEWVVVSSSAMNMQQHSGGVNPQSMNPPNSGAPAPQSMGGSPIPGMANPHAAPTQPLPAGHPPIDSGTAQ